MIKAYIEAADGPHQPWGFWATAGLGLVVVGAFFLVQILVAVGFVVIELSLHPGTDLNAYATSMETDGLFWSLALCAAAPLGLALIYVFVRMRKAAPFKAYLALSPVGSTALLKWLAFALLYFVIYDTLTHVLGRPIVPEFMRQVYKTARLTPILWLAIVIVAPLFEEVLFRGFLLEGFSRSRLGPLGAIFLTALTWTTIHLQYDLYELSWIFVLGWILGIARLTSRSLYPPLAIHAFANLIATTEAALLA